MVQIHDSSTFGYQNLFKVSILCSQIRIPSWKPHLANRNDDLITEKAARYTGNEIPNTDAIATNRNISLVLGQWKCQHYLQVDELLFASFTHEYFGAEGRMSGRWQDITAYAKLRKFIRKLTSTWDTAHSLGYTNLSIKRTTMTCHRVVWKRNLHRTMKARNIDSLLSLSGYTNVRLQPI